VKQRERARRVQYCVHRVFFSTGPRKLREYCPRRRFFRRLFRTFPGRWSGATTATGPSCCVREKPLRRVVVKRNRIRKRRNPISGRTDENRPRPSTTSNDDTGNDVAFLICALSFIFRLGLNYNRRFVYTVSVVTVEWTRRLGQPSFT